MFENRTQPDGSAYLDKPYLADIRPLTDSRHIDLSRYAYDCVQLGFLRPKPNSFLRN